MVCKNGGQERGIETSDVCDAQTEKFPSKTLMRDQKYAHLKFMTTLKSAYKYGKNVMQD